MKALLSLTLAMALMAGMGTAFAQEEQKSEQPTGKATILKGEVIDISCYTTMGAKGASHKACALQCAQNGEPVGLLEDGTGKVYTFIMPLGKNLTKTVEGYMADHVQVKGTVMEKGGATLMNIESIEKLKD